MNLERIKKTLGDKFFGVVFQKKDGSFRKMNARLGVTKHLKGGNKRYDAESYGYLTVFDIQKGQYRTLNTDSIVELKAKGKIYTVNNGELTQSV